MTDRVSPSRLQTYLNCPRQFEFKYIHDLDGGERTDLERYFNRGDVLDTALQLTATEVDTDTDPETVQSLARENFTECWQRKTDSDTYPSPAAYEFDRRISAAAIDDYLEAETDGEGLAHLRRSVGTEVHLEWTDDELGAMHGYADNIVETRDGLLIIDYKASYSGRRFPNKNGSDLEKQLNGTNHYPSRLKKWLQLGMYWEGLTQHELYSPGDEIRFMFYGLIASKERTPTKTGYSVDVRGKAWEMTDLYRENTSAFRTLIDESTTGIQSGAFDPTGDRWELIQEEACGDCDYQSACGDYIAEEVKFS
ncbi:PD-(D/E)XK nuclease family protein [Haloarchaeobius sp. FL176]|uniref:RecB family exonuclease n=1 Tax=Haloarchaeobius sp. FL176 TaxID=2967129 RepID=UPI002148C69B